jgi:hypothetical protein
MTENLPFVHPAHDPSTETMARARSHVVRTVRRRRVQRRAVGSAAFAALAVAGVAGAVGTLGTGGDGTGDGDADVAAENESHVGDREDVVPDTEWIDPVLSEDGRRLTIMVGSAPPGDHPCNQNFEYEVVETGESVTVGFDELPDVAVPRGDEVACTDALEPQRFEIELEASLGDRDVFDGVGSTPKQVHRLAELVDVTAVPDGWTTDGPLAVGPTGWQQTFHRDGADWYFAVNQRPEDDATTPEGTPTPVTVHGIEGLRYSGQMNNTMESIVWVEDGLSITVWGEMQGPPTFTHSDELLEIAEGVRPPADD